MKSIMTASCRQMRRCYGRVREIYTDSALTQLDTQSLGYFLAERSSDISILPLTTTT